MYFSGYSCKVTKKVAENQTFPKIFSISVITCHYFNLTN